MSRPIAVNMRRHSFSSPMQTRIVSGTNSSGRRVEIVEFGGQRREVIRSPAVALALQFSSRCFNRGFWSILLILVGRWIVDESHLDQKSTLALDWMLRLVSNVDVDFGDVLPMVRTRVDRSLAGVFLFLFSDTCSANEPPQQNSHQRHQRQLWGTRLKFIAALEASGPPFSHFPRFSVASVWLQLDW
jgi:hypothetical protein